MDWVLCHHQSFEELGVSGCQTRRTTAVAPTSRAIGHTPNLEIRSIDRVCLFQRNQLYLLYQILIKNHY